MMSAFNNLYFMFWSSPDSDYVYKISYFLRVLSASFIFSFSITSTF